MHIRVLLLGIALLALGCGQPGPTADPGTVSPDSGGTPPPAPSPPPPDPTPGAWYKPDPATTWQWQLTGAINTSYAVGMYDIDLFDSPASLIAGLQADGKRVICYFSAGSYEDWRPDAADFLPVDLGNGLGWPGEKWLDTRSANVRAIMQARLDLAVQKGCDGVEPDNVDGYANSNGLGLTAADQLDYNRFLATESHARGLSVGLKNDVDQVAQLVGDFDFTLNEQCHQYNECGTLKPFSDAGKAVFNAEYASKYKTDPTALCASAIAANMRTLVLPLDLNDNFRISCD